MTKVWKFIASLIGQIILAVVIVGLLAFWNPGDFFSSTKHTLKDTPILVRAMKEIGQLITAEYYGETVADNFTIVELDSTEKVDEFKKLLEMHAFFSTEINEMREDYKDLPRNRNKLTEYYLTTYSTLSDDSESQVLKEYYLKFHDKPDLGKLLQYLVKTKRGREEEIGEPESLKRFMEKYYAASAIPGKVKKKELLVIVGRGWVKTGYDFKKFEPHNFIYSPERKRVYLSGMKPFMEVTMNPWFIPEKGVEGFEFIMMGKEAAHNRQTVLETKLKCRTQLIKQAEEREILKMAKENAEENLKAFVSLIMDEEIVSVQIYESLIDANWNFFMEDSTISVDELRIIELEFLKNDFHGELSGKKLREFEAYGEYIPKIRKEFDLRYPAEGMIEQIAADGLLDLIDQELLRGYKTNAFDSTWYGALELKEHLINGSFHYRIEVQPDSIVPLEEIDSLIRNDLREKINGVQFEENDSIRTSIDPLKIDSLINESLRLYINQADS
jgi:hypothetical protein